MENTNWHVKYFNKKLIDDIDNSLLLLINNTQNINNLKTKIEKQEEYYLVKIQEIKKNYNKNTIEKKYKNKTALEILRKELEIIKLISRYSLQNNSLDYEFIITSLKYLLHLSEILRNKLKQKEIVYQSYDSKIGIPRCSYKFCSFKESCSYNYNKKNNHCYQDHYVHNMVSHDIEVLISFIQNKYNKKSKIKPNKEILKSINTLSYVINHMENELKSRCIYLEEKDWDKHHFCNSVKKNIT